MPGEERATGSGVPGDDPFGLYLHVPFCRSRCHYCAFYFLPGRRAVDDATVDALAAELARGAADPRFAGRPVHSVYLGGGTPSLLEPAQLARLLDVVRARWPLAEDAEVSLEANPEGLPAGRLAGFRAAGANRLTLGWQALDADSLRFLTRTHTPEDAFAALATARVAGFDNVGVDLIFGRAGQTPDAWRAELAAAGTAGVEHLSAYELTLEEGTRLARRAGRGDFALPDEDARAAMFDDVDAALAPHGLARYEISNFAKPGRECVHNLATWRGGDLLGVGPSAASRAGAERWKNVADLGPWTARVAAGQDAAAERETLDPPTRAAEDLYLGLRTADGVDAGDVLGDVPEPARGRLERALATAQQSGLLEAGAGEALRLTRRGRLLADTVFDALLGG